MDCNKDAVSRVTCIYRIKQVSLSLPLLSLYCWFTMLLTIVLFSPSLSNSKRGRCVPPQQAVRHHATALTHPDEINHITEEPNR